VKLAADVTKIPTGTRYFKEGSTGEKSMVAITVTTGEDLKAGKTVYVEKETVASGHKIVINAATWPGTYKLVGETWARNRSTGDDEYFQFVIPQAKMSAENTITLEAEGDPSVFDMTMRVLRPEDGNMME